jgi:hypothetical protein
MLRNRPVRAPAGEREEIRPQMSGKPGSPPKMPAGSLRHARGTAMHIGLSARSGRLSMQRVVAKVSYHQVGGVRGLVRYVAHDGPDEDGHDQEQVIGFSESGDAVDGYAVTKTWQDAGDPRYFHVIVSPENGDKIGDMKDVIRPGMEQVQRDLGCRVEWISYQHDRDKDAQGRHAHVLIRGVDRDGKELLIAPEYVQKGFSYRFSERATKEIGPRSEREIRDGLERSEQLREHKMEKDRLMNVAVERGAISQRQAKNLNREYAKSSQDGKDQVVQRVKAAIDRTPTHEPEMTP